MNAAPLFPLTLQALLRSPKPIETDRDNEIARAQQEHAVKQMPLMAMSSAFAVIAVSIVMTFYTDTWKVATWGILGIGMAALQYAGWQRFRGRPMPQRVSGGFLRKLELTAMVFGLVWGGAMLLLPTSEDFPRYIFIFSMQLGMIAGLSNLLAPLPRVTIRFGFTAALPGFVISLLMAQEVTIMLAIMAVVFLVAMVAGSVNSHYQLARMVSSLMEASDARRDLTDAIESLNDAFSVRGPDGELLLANARFRDWFPNVEDASEGMADEPYRIMDGRWVLRTDRPTAKGGRVTIHADVSVLKNRERELIAARSEAEKADEAKSRFLSSMSHELMMPLNIILGFSKLMKDGSNIRLSKDEVAEYATNIYRSGDHLLRLTSDIIDYSKMGLDKYLLNRELVDVRELVDDAVRLTEMHFELERDARIKVHVAPGIGALVADRFAMKRIVTALLSNAVKFSDAGKQIRLRVGLTDQEQPYVMVRDFGPGIAESQLEKVFEAFHQVNRDPVHSRGGTGLGLTLCRHLVRLHGGDVHLKNHDKGGLSAIVLLPKAVHRQTGNLQQARDDEHQSVA